ncbi:MAG TPA: hypothetical protein VJS46_06680 [Rhizorhapis sp.]|nr:hypothetical protein [Rhizorhapis sp.]
MATGYENRQPTRNSFAFNPAAPVQSRERVGGSFRGAQLVGGRSTGGTGGADQFTPAQPMASGLGQFFEQLMAPHVQRRQDEVFWDGFTAQSQRKAGEEIKSRGGIISEIFGPTGYEEGAVFYRANTNVENWANKKLAEVDDLKRLSPEDLSKTIYADYQGLLTDDPLVNQTIQAGMFKAAQPVLDAVYKAQQQWKQQEGKTQQASFIMARAERQQAYLSDERNIPDQATIDQMTADFLDATRKPYGMTDESWHDNIVTVTRRMAQMGYGYGVQAFMKAGLLDTLPPEDQLKLEDGLLRYAGRATAKALGQPAIMEDLGKLKAEEALVRIGRPVPGGAAGHMQRLQALNDRIKRVTGFDHDLFDAKEIVQGGMSVVEGIASFEEKRRARLEALDDMETRHRWDTEKDEQEEAEAATAAHAAWATGDVKEALLTGKVKESDFEIIANNALAQGQYDGLARAFGKGWLSGVVRSKTQAAARNSIGKQYTDGTKRAYEQWQAMRKINPAMTQAYYGPTLMAQMENFHRQVGTIGPNMAFQQAFNNPFQYSTASWPVAKQREAKAAIKKIVDSRGERGWFGRGLNESAREALTETIWRESAVIAQNSDRLPDDIAIDTGKAVLQDGRFEGYGRLGWRNPEGMSTIGSLIGLQGNPEMADSVVADMIDRRLKAAGFADGAGAERYNIMRLNDEHDHPALYVRAGAGDEARTVIIGLADFQKAATDAVAAGIARYSKPRAPNATMQKVIAQNRANVAARDARPGREIDLLDPVVTAGKAVAHGVTSVAESITSRVEASAAKRAARKRRRTR